MKKVLKHKTKTESKFLDLFLYILFFLVWASVSFSRFSFDFWLFNYLYLVPYLFIIWRSFHYSRVWQKILSVAFIVLFGFIFFIRIFFVTLNYLGFGSQHIRQTEILTDRFKIVFDKVYITSRDLPRLSVDYEKNPVPGITYKKRLYYGRAKLSSSPKIIDETLIFIITPSTYQMDDKPIEIKIAVR